MSGIRESLIAITIDYETWQPATEEHPINWQQNLITNTYSLLECAESVGAKLTIMAEMGEYLWLEQNMPGIANNITYQLQEIVQRGHDVQLNLHPNWLPETGASYDNGKYYFNEDIAGANDYPFDLTELIGRCKHKLEEIIKPIDHTYHVNCFRAGSYRVQTFHRLSEALKDNGIFCDSSVYKGGISKERGYCFKECRSAHQPYFCDNEDPQHENKNSNMIEIPICTFPKYGRWFLDNDAAYIFGRQFLYAKQEMCAFKTNMYVLIGHSKGKHDYDAIKRQLKMIKQCPNTNFVTLSTINTISREKKCQFENASPSLDEILEITKHLYSIITPEQNRSNDISDILIDGYALCLGYTALLVVFARRFNYRMKPLSLYATNMPNGRGNKKWDTHEVAYLSLKRKKYIIDAMADTCIPFNIRTVLKNPSLAVEKRNPDDRYRIRNYCYYDTYLFYERVSSFKIGDYGVCKPSGVVEGRRAFISRRILNFFSRIQRMITFKNFWRPKSI